jgi:hypothetical protein
MDTVKKVPYSGVFLCPHTKTPYNQFKDRWAVEVTMSKIIFNDFQMKRLENNLYVKQVSECSIAYHPDFKVKAVKENQAGKLPTHIFIEHGFDLKMIGTDKPKGCLKRWRKIFEQYGEDGLRSVVGKAVEEDQNPSRIHRRIIKYLREEEEGWRPHHQNDFRE